MKYLSSFIVLLTTLSFAGSTAFAEPTPPRRIQYNVEVLIDGKVAIQSVPVTAPEGGTVSFSPSSPKDEHEVVFKLISRVDREGMAVDGRFQAKDQGETVSDTPFGDLIAGQTDGVFQFTHEGKNYTLRITPS